MPKCPKCGKEIDRLSYHEERDYDAVVEVVDGKLSRLEEKENVEVSYYSCPKCDEEIAQSDEDALKFLQGQESPG